MIIGGIGWNDVTRRMVDLRQLPVQQVEDPRVKSGEIFVRATDDRLETYSLRCLPETEELIEDVGMIVRMTNPLNSNHTFTICSGIHSRGVLGALRTLTGTRFCDSNERYIAQHSPGNQYGIIMRVQVIAGQTLTPDFFSKGTALC